LTKLNHKVNDINKIAKWYLYPINFPVFQKEM